MFASSEVGGGIANGDASPDDDGSSDDEDGVRSPDVPSGGNNDGSAGEPAVQNLSAIRMTTQGVAKVLGEDKMNRAERMKISREDRIIARRGAFLWLPVMFCNDMVHGSW
jgi:hypothetical protein